MIKLRLVLIILIFQISNAFAQFNPGAAEKSLVKVMVTGGNKMGVCSGFVWKKKSWVVTSLHAMKPGGKIQVVYPGDNVREGKVLKVLETADLVLLETNVGEKPVTNEVTPLDAYHQGDVPFGESIYAIGYNGGSKGDQTQKLEKGHANPETLEFLVRPEDKAQLTSLGFPSMKLPIYFLNGSLLPGFSGSPVFNMKNELIGIGDGGLERGLMNVSWCIPASYLGQLETSATSTLPAGLASASVLYSAEVSIDVAPDKTIDDFNSVQQQVSKKYSAYSHGGFDFFQTKTRTFDEMQKTSTDPNNMEGFAQEFRESNLLIEYDLLNFDIYEDIGNGFALAIPEGTDLTYDEKYDMFSVDLTNFPEGKYFSLFYYKIDHNGDPVKEITSDLNEEFGKDYQGITEEPKYSKSFQLNNTWKVNYLLLNGNKPFAEEGLGNVSTSFYLNIISNGSTAFCSIAVCYIPEDRDDINQAFENGIDCVNHYDDNQNACEYFESLMQIVAAAHLTTKSFLN